MSSRSRAASLFAALSFIVCAAAATSVRAEEKAAVTSRAVSPSDGSLWIATDGDGIFRLGRNGRTVRYTEAGGHLGSDSVVWLSFDNKQLLWILDGSGYFRTYSSVHGFQVQDGLPGGILTAASSDQNASLIYFATNTALYSFEALTGKWNKVVDLSLVPVSLLVDNSKDEIWVFGQNAVLKCTPEGVLTQWEQGASVSNLLPFVFDTNVESTTVEQRFYFPIWIVILSLICAFFAGWLLSSVRTNLFKNINSDKVIETVVLKAEGSPENLENAKPSAPLATSDTTSSITLDVAPVKDNSRGKVSGKFTKTVLALIDENISDYNFDVDKLADLTGMSRIHLNRKLKAEGADTPSTLIKNARMSMAVKLLENNRLTIAQVSSECGFRTPSYFATAFKEFYGVSPTEFLASSDL